MTIVSNGLHSIAVKRDYNLLEHVDLLRLEVNSKLDEQRKVLLGQFLTPAPIARLIACLFVCDEPNIHILDAGAGVGSLVAALIDVLCHRKVKPESIRVTAYEIDELMISYLSKVLLLCQIACEHANIVFSGEIIQQDFIEQGSALLEENLFSSAASPHFTCAILNPPYRKLHTQSKERKLLSRVGIEVSNLYTGFLALATQLLAHRGEVVAITPRSFCNGPYFKKFRQTFVETMKLRQIHLFETRTHAFRDNDVLQENIIVHAIKDREQRQEITITSSVGVDDEYTSVRTVSYSSVINPTDSEAFIHIVPDDWGQQVIKQISRLQCSLESLGLSVSTGRVVDFRAVEFLRKLPEMGTAPLLFPTHLTNGGICWPKIDAKKPNAIAVTDVSMSLLVPNEHYVLVKRFSAKEEKRRVVAVVYDASKLEGAWVGFENHLNYFHLQGRGLSLKLARGLAAYLNSTLVDAYFRQFNGHTQVNATDLRKLPYPTLVQLEALGDRMTAELLSQHELDNIVKEVLLSMDSASNAQERDPIQMKQRIEEALSILKALGLPRAQHNERSALTLLALLNLSPTMAWSQASNPLCGITPMMEFFNQHYGKNYAPNARETVRRQTVHQFIEAGLIEANPDQPERPINSPKAVYRIEQGALELLRTFGTPEWEQKL